MQRLRPYPVTAFCLVTLLTWGNRIWLAWTNAHDTLAEKLVWSIPITLFVIAGAALLGWIVRGRGVGTPPFVRAVQVFAGATVAYWAVRAPIIVATSHPEVDDELAFKIVHVVLAVISITAAAAAWRAVADRRGEGAGSDTGPGDRSAGEPRVGALG
jgi:hypothetical protein